VPAALWVGIGSSLFGAALLAAALLMFGARSRAGSRRSAKTVLAS
jgi:hypothetical protein